MMQRDRSEETPETLVIGRLLGDDPGWQKRVCFKPIHYNSGCREAKIEQHQNANGHIGRSSVRKNNERLAAPTNFSEKVLIRSLRTSSSLEMQHYSQKKS